jgi:AcrR family transcriptional regulator
MPNSTHLDLTQFGFFSKRTNVHLFNQRKMAWVKCSDCRKAAQEILDESLSFIAKLGYAAVTTRMIAHTLGVNVGALYDHFPNKQRLHCAVLVTV